MEFTWLDAILVLIAVALAIVMLRPSIKNSANWRATVTPLASIIGSGFLVIAPLLASIAGDEAVYAMAIIILFSIWIGSALRFVIANEDTLTDSHPLSLKSLEAISDLALAFAYVISIAFYIRLMAGFVLSDTDVFGASAANALATAVLAFIGFYGWRHGLSGLERLEEYSVTIKLSIIGALLTALAYTDISTSAPFSLPQSPDNQFERLRMLGGMLLVVQGFETSKYLGSTYSAELRIRSMRQAQYIAAAIYMLFVALSMPLMNRLDLAHPSETAIIDLARSMTFILPFMLIIAAVMSQFSAAVADTLGSGGVVSQQTKNRLPIRATYPLITGISICIIWYANIFELITYASRTFAFYYAIQSTMALRLAIGRFSGMRRFALAFSYLALTVTLLFVIGFGMPVAA